RPHGPQHALDIGMLIDTYCAGPRIVYRLPLKPVRCVSPGLLRGTFGHSDSLHPNGESGGVHHDEHVRQAVVELSDQISNRAFSGLAPSRSIQHDRRRAAMYAQLVLERGTGHIVAGPQCSVLGGDELGNNEQRDALHPGRSVGKTGKHQVYDVLGQIMLAVSDENLLTKQTETAVWLRFCTGL